MDKTLVLSDKTAFRLDKTSNLLMVCERNTFTEKNEKWNTFTEKNEKWLYYVWFIKCSDVLLFNVNLPLISRM